MYEKKLILVLLFISSISFAQTIGSSKDIADIVWPNPEVKLFYGNANYSADHIVVLPEHIIIYNAEKASFYLLDKASKLTVSELSLFDIKRLVTSRVRYGEMVNNKFRTLHVYKTPFIAHTFANQLKMYSLSDTSAYGGLVRIRRDFKIVNLYVRNDSLKLDLIDFNPKKSFRKITKKEKRQKLRFDAFQTRYYSDFEQVGDKQFFAYGSSPYKHKMDIKSSSFGRNSYRDSVLNYNALFYKQKGSDSLKLFYQNSYKKIASRLRSTSNGNGINGYYVSPQLFRIKDKLALWQGRGLDSLIVFDKNLKRIFTSVLKEDFVRSSVDTSLLDTSKLSHHYIHVFKDEFTEKLYIEFLGGRKGNPIYELKLNYETQTCEFIFLRRYTYYGNWIKPIAINKGMMYLQTENSLVGNNYIYVYDLYANAGVKDDILEIKFKKVEHQIERKTNLNAYILKYQKHKPLQKKVRKAYFGKIKRDMSLFKQDSHLNVLTSIYKAMDADSLDYVLSYLIAYSGIERLEMDDDMKAKNYMFFDFMKEGFRKESALSQMKYFIDSFNSFDTQMYKNRMMVRTPNGIFFTLLKIDGLWYLESTIKKISSEAVENQSN